MNGLTMSDIKEEIKRYLETNENGNTTQNSCDTVKAIQEGNPEHYSPIPGNKKNLK